MFSLNLQILKALPPEGIHSVRGRLTLAKMNTDGRSYMGDKPEQFRETSIQLAKMGFKGIDLNMGCPVANVAKKGKGSGLILRPDVAAEIIQATKAGGLPVSVKTRLGYYEIDEWKDWLKHVFEQDIANLSIHLRTRKEMSKVDAHWELIEAIKNLRDEIAPNTLLTINGDIPDRKTGLELAEKYSIDGVMIGRGIFHNPFAFEKEPREHTSKELLDLLRLHLSLFNKYEKDEIRQFKSLRRFFKIYVRGIRGASELRHQLMNTQSIAEARALLDEFEAQMDEDVKMNYSMSNKVEDDIPPI
ncbi:tRNA-dihydrouridine synthase 2 [Staphylococcus aureus]|nr:tRNA-dihydrouridine synthase 2 [Staphylococcus aureus]